MIYKKVIKRKTIIISLLLLTTCTISHCGFGNKGSKIITVGSKGFTEQYIMANIITLLLEYNGFRIRERFGTGSMITRMGLLTGQIDLYPEYTGTAWILYLSHREKFNNPDVLFSEVKKEDYEKNRVVWLYKTNVNNTYALAVRMDDINKFGKSLSSLAEYLKICKQPVIFGISHEFYERPDGFKQMALTYGLKIKETNIRTMNIGLTFESISRGQIDVAMVFSTDGKLKKYNLEILHDNKAFFPIYNLCFVINEGALIKYPEIKDILKPLLKHLDNKTMQDLNYQVDVMGKPSKLVGSQFLKEKGIIE